MARKTGGQLNPTTGRVETGRMPRGSVEDPKTIKTIGILDSIRFLRGK